MDANMLETVIVRAAQTENTPELGRYWKEKYQDIINQKLFTLHPETVELAMSQAMDKPATSLGDVVLNSHVKNDGSLDAPALINTIEIAVRLLDAILEIIPFEPSARHIVNSYRKIGLGAADIQEFFENHTQSSTLENIDSIGQQMSTSSYRASEMLALEKGACTNWQLIAYHLRPKLFEIWQHDTSKDERNGLEMSEQFTADTIADSGYAIKPRRNSNILMFPADSEWHIWSDRDQTAAPTPITQQPQPNQPQTKKPEQQPVIPDTPEPQQEQQPHYQIGELVVVQTADVSEYEKVYQVIDIHHSPDQILYELTGGNPELEEKRWTEDQLEPVDLTDILHKVNEVDDTPATDTEIRVIAHPVLLNPDGDAVLVQKDGQKIDLPTFSIGKNQIPERVVTIGMCDQYGIQLEEVMEIGSSITHTNSFGVSTLHMGYTARPAQITHPDFGWFQISNADVLPLYIQTLLRKRRAMLKSTTQKDTQINTLQAKIVELEKTLQNQKTELHLHKNGKDRDPVADQTPQFVDVATSRDSVIYTSNFHIIQSMSKYALKLEQLVQTTKFGDVAVNLQYDSTGAKVVTARGTQVANELQQQLEVVLGLVNLCLSKSVSPADIATQLEKPTSGQKVDLSDVVKVIAASLKQAPKTADEINGTMLDDLSAEKTEAKPTPAAKQKPKSEPKAVEVKQQPMQQQAPTQPAPQPQQQPAPAPQPTQPQQPMQQPQQNNGGNGNSKPTFNPFARK